MIQKSTGRITSRRGCAKRSEADKVRHEKSDVPGERARGPVCSSSSSTSSDSSRQRDEKMNDGGGVDQLLNVYVLLYICMYNVEAAASPCGGAADAVNDCVSSFLSVWKRIARTKKDGQAGVIQLLRSRRAL